MSVHLCPASHAFSQGTLVVRGRSCRVLSLAWCRRDRGNRQCRTPGLDRALARTTPHRGHHRPPSASRSQVNFRTAGPSLLLAARLCQPHRPGQRSEWARRPVPNPLGHPRRQAQRRPPRPPLDAFFDQRHSILAAVTDHGLALVAELSLDTPPLRHHPRHLLRRLRQLPAHALRTPPTSPPSPSDSLLSPAHITQGYLSEPTHAPRRHHRRRRRPAAPCPIFATCVDGNQQRPHRHPRTIRTAATTTCPCPTACCWSPTAAPSPPNTSPGCIATAITSLCSVPWNDYRACMTTTRPTWTGRRPLLLRRNSSAAATPTRPCRSSITNSPWSSTN